jgi:hypothetical protein
MGEGKIIPLMGTEFKRDTVEDNPSFFFHSRTVHLGIIRVFYSPNDAQESCLKKY